MIGSSKNRQLMRQGSILLLLLVMLISTSGFAANDTDTKIFLEMNDLKIQMGVGTKMSMVFENLKDQAEVLSFEGLDHFEIRSHSQSNSTSIINGKVTKENRVDYMMMPKETGTFELKATVKVGKETYETNTLTVIVEEQDESLSEVNQDIFLKTTVSDDVLYFGENTVITYELYSRYQVDECAFTEATTCDGFIAEEGNLDNSPSYLTIDGKKYVKYTVKQLVLSPIQSGNFTIPAFNFQANLSTGGFFGETKPSYLKSDEVNVTVLPVPDAGKPVDDTGLVGNMQLSYTYSKDTASLDEPVTLDVTLIGEGNLYTLDSIAGKMDLSDFSVYETEDEPKVSTDEDGHVIEKHFEIILIPKSSQDVTIPELMIPYFNVETEQYDRLMINEKTIHVTDGGHLQSGDDSSSYFEGGQSEEPVIINQVSYGDYGDDMFVIALSKRKVKLWNIFILGIIGIAGVVFWVTKKPLQKNTYLKALKNANSESALYELLAKYMLEIHEVFIKSMTVDAIRSTLEGHDHLDKMLDLIHYFEHDRYQKKRSIEMLKTDLEMVFKN